MKMMKKTVALTLAVLFLMTVLVSCGDKGFSGKYVSKEALGSDVAYTFSGDTVEMTVSALGNVIVSLSGTYEIGDGVITLTFDGEDGTADSYSGTFDFSGSEDGETITIGLLEYTKAKD